IGFSIVAPDAGTLFTDVDISEFVIGDCAFALLLLPGANEDRRNPSFVVVDQLILRNVIVLGRGEGVELPSHQALVQAHPVVAVIEDGAVIDPGKQPGLGINLVDVNTPPRLAGTLIERDDID
ncbi:MAG: hypothetical protein KAU10_06965, partial [Dehalococcoidia bacterium]|nr:hypothetical protein [Dehalococcoidia bacterium]